MTAPRFLRDALSIAASQYIARGVLLARGVIAAAALGPRGYGHWNALHLVFDYGPFATAGAVQGLDLAMPGASARGDRALEVRLMRGAWTAAIAGSALFGAVLAVHLATGRRAIAAGWGPGAVVLMMVAACFQIALQVQAAALRARGRFDAVSLATGVQALAGGLLGALLVWPYGAWGLIGGWLAGSVLALFVQGVAAPDLAVAPGEPGIAIGLARAGFPVFAFFALSLVLRSLDRLALVRFGEPAGLGVYSLGLMTTGLVLYLPESAAFVLYPRVAAAAQGARDVVQTWTEVARVHRTLGAFLPPLVAVGMVWAGLVVEWLLPAFREGVPVVHRLAMGAVLLSASTVPAYFLLAAGRRGALLTVGAVAAACAAALVFAVAARDSRPGTVAIAAVGGYGLFALGLVALASRALFARMRDRLGFVWASFVPPLWAAGVALAVCATGPQGSPLWALGRTAVVLLACLPVAWWFGRGLGARSLLDAWRNRFSGGTP
jgi:O-antigen/teichoic acid export membrane protein